MSRVDLDVDDRELRRLLRQLEERAGRLRPAFETIGRKLKSRVQLGFRASSEPGGQPWRPIEHRQGKPLLDTGRLRNSITTRAADQYVDLGTNVVYARVHQYGSGQVRAHVRRITQAFGRRLATPVAVQVRAHQGGVKARPYLPIDRVGGLALPDRWARDVQISLRNHLLRGNDQ